MRHYLMDILCVLNMEQFVCITDNKNGELYRGYVKDIPFDKSLDFLANEYKYVIDQIYSNVIGANGELVSCVEIFVDNQEVETCKPVAVRVVEPAPKDENND